MKPQFIETKVSIPVFFKGLDFIININSFNYYPGTPGTYWEPPEPDEFEPISLNVELDGSVSDIIKITSGDIDLIMQMTNDNESLYEDMMEDDTILDLVYESMGNHVYRDNRYY